MAESIGLSDPMRSAMSNSAGFSKCIVVLFHAGDRHNEPSSYIVDHLARCWREDGHTVTYLFGTRRFVPADLIFVHVNLSVVPDAYLNFASRYPIVVNGRIRDIRKSTMSRNLLGPSDSWDGRVIVKSDLNYAGEPERTLRQSWLQRRFPVWRRVARTAARVTGQQTPFPSWRDYMVFDRLADVPGFWFRNRHAVVERFRPEIQDGLYHLRIYQFLGDRWSCSRLASPHPLVKAGTSVRVEPIEPHAEIVAWREMLDIDYGKLDYVIHEGEVVLLDVNKTTGASRHLGDAELRSMRRYQAEGLYAYFA
jgi:hypothetical protein